MSGPRHELEPQRVAIDIGRFEKKPWAGVSSLVESGDRWRRGHDLHRRWSARRCMGDIRDDPAGVGRERERVRADGVRVRRVT